MPDAAPQRVHHGRGLAEPIGQGVGLDFSRNGALVEVDSVEEGRFEGERWVGGRYDV